MGEFALIINSNLSKHHFKEKARSIVNNIFGLAILHKHLSHVKRSCEMT